MNRIAPCVLATVAAVAPLTLSACGADFEPASLVSSLRVLAIAADRPYAKPGDTVRLTSLWYDPQKRATQWGWAVCVNPESSTVLGCFQRIFKDAQETGRPSTFAIGANKDSFDLVVPADTLTRLSPEARKNALLGVISVVCPGTLKLADGLTADSKDVPLRCIDATGRSLGLDEYVAGIKRIFVRASDIKSNPKIARVAWDGQDWKDSDVKQVVGCDTQENRFSRCPNPDKHDVAIEVTPESFGQGVDEFGNPFTEQVIVEYYATEGLFEHDVRVAKSPTTAWYARANARGKPLTMWLVARDNRGGVVWAQRSIDVK